MKGYNVRWEEGRREEGKTEGREEGGKKEKGGRKEGVDRRREKRTRGGVRMQMFRDKIAWRFEAEGKVLCLCFPLTFAFHLSFC